MVTTTQTNADYNRILNEVRVGCYGISVLNSVINSLTINDVKRHTGDDSHVTDDVARDILHAIRDSVISLDDENSFD